MSTEYRTVLKEYCHSLSQSALRPDQLSFVDNALSKCCLQVTLENPMLKSQDLDRFAIESLTIGLNSEDGSCTLPSLKLIHVRIR